MPETVTRFSCPYLKNEVELTSEREQHITDNHPELLATHRTLIGETLADPDQVRHSTQVPSAFMFSKRCEGSLEGKSIVVVVMTGAGGNQRNWIVTAYLTRKLTGGEIEWKRS